MTRTTSRPLFTEADLVCDGPFPLPPHLELQTVPDQFSSDIVADLEAMTPLVSVPVNPDPPPAPFPTIPFAPAPPPTATPPRHTFTHSPTPHPAHHHRLLHSRPRPTVVPVQSFKCEPRLGSPTDIAWPGMPGTSATAVSIPRLPERELSFVATSEIPLPTRAPVEGRVKAAKQIGKQKRSRKNETPHPSRFCHICARTQKSRKMYCGNLNSERKCRKSVCEPCFIELRWDFEAALMMQGKWLCPHCRGICGSVPRARCHIYTRTNEKRKAARLVS